MVCKELSKALLYSSTKYHALVNPAGVATHIGTPDICLAVYHELRFGVIIIRDEDTERARVSLANSGWQIVPVRMGIFSQDVTEDDIGKIAKRP